MTQNPKTSLKKTNIPWIWEIPEDWEVLPIRWLFFETDLRSKSWEETLLSVSQYTWVTKREDNIDTEVDNLTNASTLEWYKIVREKDLVINIMLAWNWSLAVSNYDGITSPAYATFQAKEDTHPEYFHYLLRTEMMKTEFKRFSTGIIDSRLRLYPDSFLRIYTIKPPLSTQSAIANFLDEKTSKISQFIENKKNLIELLKEQKQSIIHRAVTKGIDPSVKMKESGIPWIGEIPEEWEVRRLKTVSKSVQTWSTPKDPDKNPAFLNGNIPWYWPSDFNDSLILPNETSKMINQSAMDDWELNLYPENTVFIIWIGATLGKIWLSRVKSSSNQQLNAIILSERVIPEFWVYFLNATQEIIKNLANSATLPILNQTQTKNLFFFLPSLHIQKNIIRHIEKETLQIDRVIETIEQEITLIEEYQTSLIYQAVTGKISIS